MTSQIHQIPGIIPEIPIGTTHMTLAYLAQLSTGQLDKLKTIYETSLASSQVARQFSLTISMYALAVAVIAGATSYFIPDDYDNLKRVFAAVSVTAGIAAGLSSFASLVQTIEIADYRYWRDVCVTFMNPS